MRRGLVVAMGFGIANAIVAAVLLAAVPSAPRATGWFAYAPLQDTVRQTSPPWDRVSIVLPVALVVLNLGLVLLSVRRRWLDHSSPGPSQGA